MEKDNIRRRISAEDLNDFITTRFKNKSDFTKKAKLSRSHLNGLLNGRVSLGPTVATRFSKILEEYDMQLEDILLPIPMKIGSDAVDEIVITRNDELIVSITSRDVIVHDDYIVQFLPEKRPLP